MGKVLRIRVGAEYKYEELAQFFGDEDYIQGVKTPEIEMQLGERTVNLVFEKERIVMDGDSGEIVMYKDNRYKLVEINSWVTNER